MFEVLDPVDDPLGGLRIEFEALRLCLGENRRAACELTHHDPGPVTHDIGIEMFVSVGTPGECRCVETGLVGECR